MEGCPLEFMDGRYDRTGRVWETLEDAEQRLVPGVLEIRDADLITIWSPIGIYISVWVRQTGPLKLTGQIFHNIEGERRDALTGAIPGSEDGVSFHLDEYGTLWAETDAQDETALADALERLTGQIRAHLDHLTRVLDRLRPEEFSYFPVVREVLEQTGEQFHFEDIPEGWCFPLNHRKLEQDQMELYLMPGSASIQIFGNEVMPDEERLELLEWINEMNKSFWYMKLALDEEGHLGMGLDFLLVPQRELAREHLKHYMEIAIRTWGYCREELERREETAGEEN